MKKKALILIVPILLINISNGFSQEGTFSPLRIGDQVPNVRIDNVLNYRTTTAHLFDFDSDLIIIDFWSKYCTSCINGFPKLESLQRHFGNRIKVLLVTLNTRDQLANLFARSENVKNSSLTMVLANKVLYELFPHVGVPFQVWIDKKRKVVATTSSSSVTKRNIELVLNGNSLEEDDIRTEVMDFEVGIPLAMEGQGRQWKDFGYYSMITRLHGYSKGGSGLVVSPITRQYIEASCSFTNVSLKYLYSSIYRIPDNYTIVEDDDPNSYFHNNEMTGNLDTNICRYSYQIAVSPSRKSQLKYFMQKDLETYFGLTGFSEIRSIPCYILYAINENKKLMTQGGRSFYEILDKGYKLYNLSIKELANILGLKYSNMYLRPIIYDETGYVSNIDISLTCGLENFETLQKELAIYGLGIKIEKREVECLVLKRNVFWTNNNIK